MDRYPAKPILLAALGTLACILLLLVGFGAAGLAFYTLRVVQGVGPLTAGVLAGCFSASLLCFTLTYFTGRSVVRRLRQASADAVAQRKGLEL